MLSSEISCAWQLEIRFGDQGGLRWWLQKLDMGELKEDTREEGRPHQEETEGR